MSSHYRSLRHNCYVPIGKTNNYITTHSSTHGSGIKHMHKTGQATNLEKLRQSLSKLNVGMGKKSSAVHSKKRYINF